MQPNIFMWRLLKSLLDSDLHIIRDDVKSTKNADLIGIKLKVMEILNGLQYPMSVLKIVI